MDVLIASTGQHVQIPDGVPIDTVEAELSRVSGEAQRRRSMSPAAQGALNVFGQFAGMQPQIEEFSLPSIPGNTFGMTPDQMQGVRDTIQRNQELNAGERIRQRAQREQAMEAEQDRAQEIKLEQARHKNDLQIQKMRQEAQMELEQTRQSGALTRGEQGFQQQLARMREEFGLRGELSQQISDQDLARQMVLNEQELAIRREMESLQNRNARGLLNVQERGRMERLNAELQSIYARQTRELEAQQGNGQPDPRAYTTVRDAVVEELYRRYLNDPNFVELVDDGTGQQRANLKPNFWREVDMEVGRRFGQSGTMTVPNGGTVTWTPDGGLQVNR